MKLLICAGGTGGGVYPALSVLQALTIGSGQPTAAVSHRPSSALDDVLWVGSLGGMEEDLVKRAGISFEAVPAAGVAGVGLRRLPGNLWRLGRGLVASRRILKNFIPDVLLFTGGFVAVPMAFAARLPGMGFRPRSLLYVPDIEPGLALKTLARFTDHIAVTTDASRTYFSGRVPVTVTGYPTRPDLVAMAAAPASTLRPHPSVRAFRASARQILGLDAELPTLLVFGGSKGARSINHALLQVLPDLLAEMQIIHISGQLDWAEVKATQKNLSPEQALRYHPYPYLHAEMGAALAVADLALSRAGASSLGEFPLFGLPAILVPYPYAWRYQQVNAQYLVEHGAAQLVIDADLPAQLLPVVRGLMHNPARREQMQQAMRSLARPGAAESIASILQALAASKPSKDMSRD